MLVTWHFLPGGALAADGSPGSGAVAEQPAALPQTPDVRARRESIMTGLILLVGVILCGIVLLAFVAIWGNRVRRRARAALPHVAPRNDLWFLKPHPAASDDDVPQRRPPHGAGETPDNQQPGGG